MRIGFFTFLVAFSPQFLYPRLGVVCAKWDPKEKEDRTLALMRRMQAYARKIISEAFRKSAGAAPDVELFFAASSFQTRHIPQRRPSSHHYYKPKIKIYHQLPQHTIPT